MTRAGRMTCPGTPRYATATMTTTAGHRIDVVDVVSALLQKEQASLVHFLTGMDPYINRAAAELRKPLKGIIEADFKREGQLIALLAELGSTPRPPPVSPEQQYLAYLSIGYLVPKLAEDKKLSIAAYEATLGAVGAAHPLISSVLSSQLAQHRAELSVLSGFARTGHEQAP